jgi:hypothetical protein
MAYMLPWGNSRAPLPNGLLELLSSLLRPLEGRVKMQAIGLGLRSFSTTVRDRHASSRRRRGARVLIQTHAAPPRLIRTPLGFPVNLFALQKLFAFDPTIHGVLRLRALYDSDLGALLVAVTRTE